MGRRPSRRNPKPDRRRVLDLLAVSPSGLTEALLIAHGVSIVQLVGLIRSGLAAAATERAVAGRKTTEVARVKITDEGRRALAKSRS